MGVDGTPSRRRNQEKLLPPRISVVETLLRYGTALILEHAVSPMYIHTREREYVSAYMNFYICTRPLFCILEWNASRTDRPRKEIQTSDVTFYIYIYGRNNLIMQNILQLREKLCNYLENSSIHPIAISRSSAVKGDGYLYTVTAAIVLSRGRWC